MDSFPVSCQNCFSHKREFYVFLECKHFMCLSCSMCLADFQNLTVRCCYRNTKMSQELAAVMFEEVNKRKFLKESRAINEQSMINELTQIELEKKLSSSMISYKNEKFFGNSTSQIPSLVQMDESKIVHTFKTIDQNIHKDTIKQSSRIKAPKGIKYDHVQLQDPYLALKSPQQHFQDISHVQCLTFKQISEKPQTQNTESIKRNQTKENYICWKNYDCTKDRILAKLNYHQQKMNSALRQHYHC